MERGFGRGKLQRGAAGALAAAGLVGGVLLGTGLASGTVNNANGAIFFTSYRNADDAEIYSTKADGSAQTRLTTSTGADTDPAVSPDGTKVAFVSYRDGNNEIYSMNADGSGVTRLTNNAASDSDPAWSPDGASIAFTSQRDGNANVYKMNANGSGPVQLTSQSYVESDPAWSPDGAKVAYVANPSMDYDIFVMNADGTSQVTLYLNYGADERHPSYSPDGTRIVFDAAPPSGTADIYTMSSANGSSQTRLTNNSILDSNPVYSPDGTKIAFESLSGTEVQIHTMNTGGTSVTGLTSLSSNLHPNWGSNRGPTAAFTVSAGSTAGQSVAFDGSTSSDPDGSVANYKWDLDGDGNHETDTGTTATASHTFTTAGTATVGLKVTDDKGAFATTTRTVTIAAAPALAPAEHPIATATTVAMPDVTKLKADEARARILAAGIHADFHLEYSNREPKAGIDAGEVAEQEPAAGLQIVSNVDHLTAVNLTVYAGPKIEAKDRDKGNCEEAGVLEKALKRVDLDIGNAILDRAGLSVQRDFQLVFDKPAQATEITGFDQKGDSCRGQVSYKVAAEQRAQDLFFVLQPRSRRVTFGKDWRLTAGTPNFFTISVIDRAGHVLNGASVELDVSDLGGKDARGKTSADGKTSIKATPRRAGNIDLIATVTAGDGRTLYGVTRLAVVKRGEAGFENFLGERFKRAGAGFKLIGGAKGKPTGEDKAACTAFKATTGQAACPAGFQRNMSVVVLDNERPPSADIGLAKTASSEGIELRPGETSIFAKQALEITDLTAVAAQAKPRADFKRNAWAGVAKVAADVVARIPAAQAAAARKAGELIAATAPHLAPTLPLAHTIQTGPAGPASFDAGAVKAGLGAGQTSCDFGTVIVSGFAPTLLNQFGKYCV